MKKRLLSSMLALVMAASSFGGFSISVSAEPLEGVEYLVDFSTWEEGEYTLDEIIEGAKDSGMTLSDYSTQNSSVKYSIVNDATLGKKVLKISNTQATADGFNYALDSEITGQNATYFIKSMTTTTMQSYGLNNKYVYNSSGKPIISGAIVGTRTTVHSGGFIYPMNITSGTWIEETCVVDTSGQKFMYITDKGGRYTNNGTYKLTARNKGALTSGAVYMSSRIIDAYIEKFGVRSFPTVVDTAIYSGGDEVTDGVVSTSLTSLNVVFDHYMDESTMKAENIKLYNKTAERYEDFAGSVSYDADTFTLSIQAGNLNANSCYDLILTNGIANTDNIALKETRITFTTGAAGLEFAGFKITDEKGNDLGTQKVIASKAANAVFEVNNSIENVNVIINGIEVDYTKSEDGKAVIVPVSFENDAEYTIAFTNITDYNSNTMDDITFTVTTNEKSKDYFVNDFDYITQAAGTMLNSADLLPATSNATIAPADENYDGIFEVIDSGDGKAIKVSQPSSNTNSLGFTITFENDLFTLLGEENVVVELDYKVDNTTNSTYAAFARMNNTACLYVCNDELIQQTVGTIACGINGRDIHYKMILNSNGTMNVFADGERLSLDGNYDIKFRTQTNKPKQWQMYIQKGAAASYTIDNLRIRNYPEASLSFKNDKGIAYDSENVVPSPDTIIYVTFDNIMNENSVRKDSFTLYDSLGKEIKCIVGEYDAYEQQVALIPVDALEMGKTYEVRIDGGVANAQNRQLVKEVYTFETINVEPIEIEAVRVVDYNKLVVDFSDFIDEETLTKGDVRVGDFDVKDVRVCINPEDNKKHRAIISVNGVLDVGEGSVDITGGFDRYSRTLAGLSSTYVSEDKVYITSANVVFEENAVKPEVSIAVPGGSKFDNVAFISAYFEDETTLKEVSLNENMAVEKGGIVKLSAGEVEISEGKNGSVKIYIWDSIEGITPLVSKKVQNDYSKSFKVLAIGNSFSVDALEYLYQIAEGSGFEEIKIGNLYIGGCSLQTHWENAAADSQAYTYYKNTTGEFVKSKASMSEVLADEEWDIITIQQVSTKSGISSSYEPYLTSLAGYVNEHKSNPDAKLAWHMTWAYQNGHTASAFAEYNNDQLTMYNEIVGTVKSLILPNSYFDYVIPSGTAIQNVRTSYIGDTLTRDGFHLSYDYGRYIAGLMWFKALTGYKVEGIEYMPEGVSVEYAQVAKEAVNNAYCNPFEVTQSDYK